jgi:hypothetical protein
MAELSDLAKAVIAKIESGEIVAPSDVFGTCEYHGFLIAYDGWLLSPVQIEGDVEWREPVPMDSVDRFGIANALARQRQKTTAQAKDRREQIATQLARKLFLGEEG